MVDSKLTDEGGRLAALRRYEVLDTPREAPFDRITGLVQTVFQAPIAVVSLIEEERQWFKSCIGFNAESTSRNISFCQFTIQGRDPLYIRDATLDARVADNPQVTGEPFIRSYLGVPLCTPDGYNIGSLCVSDYRARDFSSDQVNMLASFGSLVMDELELRRIAQTDSLTGAITRRGFMVELERAMARSNRDGLPNSLVMMDLDHFKRVNDTYGHPAGDSVLRNATARLKKYMRAGDVLGRLGGEEFAVLLPATDIESAFATVERFRTAIADEPMVTEPLISVTASFGIASQPAKPIPAADWLEEADKALYEAKHSGRNKCCIA